MDFKHGISVFGIVVVCVFVCLFFTKYKVCLFVKYSSVRQVSMAVAAGQQLVQ